MNRYSTSSSPASDWLLGAVKRNPEGLLLLAAGCALMMRTRSSNESWRSPSIRSAEEGPYGSMQDGRSRSSVAGGMSQVAERASEYASDLGEKVGATARAYASSASDYADQARQTVSQYADEARRTVSEQSERFARQAQSSLQGTVSHVLQTQPLAVALAGFAAGAAIAATFPATEIEQRALGPAAEKLTEVAGQAGQQLTKAGKQAGERLMSAAEERGLSGDGLKEMAREAAGAFGSALTGEQSGSESSRGSGQGGRSSSSGSSSGQGGQSSGSSGGQGGPSSSSGSSGGQGGQSSSSGGFGGQQARTGASAGSGQPFSGTNRP